MIDVYYTLAICILVLVLVVVLSIFIRYSILRSSCYNQPSPYCPANLVCPTAVASAPQWIACQAQEKATKGCTNCGDSCYQSGGSCADPFCLNCAVPCQTQSCSLYATAQPVCPDNQTNCKTNTPTNS